MSGLTFLQTLQLAAVIAALLGVAQGALRALRGLWRRTLGMRQVERRKLNRLLLDATVESVQDVLGVPTFRSGDERGARQLTWVLPHALVKVHVNRSGAVAGFSVAVRYGTRWPFRFDITQLTRNIFGGAVVLGRTRFSEISHSGGLVSVRSFTGANRIGYAERHYFGRPGGYRYFVLAHSMVGEGAIEPVPNWDDDDEERPGDRRPDKLIAEARDAVTVNAFAVLSGGGDEMSPAELQTVLDFAPQELQVWPGMKTSNQTIGK